MRKLVQRGWIGIAVIGLVIVVGASMMVFPSTRASLADFLTMFGLAAVGVITVVAGLRAIAEHQGATQTSAQIQNANTSTIGASATVGQSAVGSNIAQTNIGTQTNITTQIIQASARQYDARFSLPRVPDHFTGRADEIETLVNALTRGQGSDVTIASITGVSGLGGIGKSALAAVVATLVADKFPDARMWLDLRGTDKNYTTPTDAMRQIIFAFDVDMGAALKDASDAQIAQTYRSILHDQRALIVLDNARDNAQVRPLLQANAAFLVTSRATLTEGGLQPLRLGVMKQEEAAEYLVALCGRLKTSPLPPLLKGEGNVVTELCEVCGFLPLALKIAGSYLAARPNVRAENYVAQLTQRRLELLREGSEAEANVEATFLQTYDQLTRASFVDFENSPLLVGGGVMRQDADVAQQSVVLAHQGVRYAMHDLLREFGASRLTDDERRTAAKQHAEFFVNVARAADELYLKGNENIIAGLKLFDQELPHIRAGQAWAAANMERDEDAARLCNDYPDAAAYVAQLRLSVRERIRWLEQAATAARKLENRQSEGNHLGNLGVAYAALGEVRKAIGFYEQALVIDREIGDRRGEGSDLGNLGNAYADLGEVRKAIGFYEQHLAIAREIGDRRGEGNALGNLGLAYAALGEVRKAIGFYEQALVIDREIGDRRGEGSDLGNLGLAYAALGEVRKAIGFYEQALVI
ncbi:MAG: tetratricopeptide repeat protein, partial [Chloroflexi bacterium]|nr:tetratricopeptide repeat protein [Chloroflexota bacterium]